MKYVYVVFGEAGMSSDWKKWACRAFTNKAAARVYCVAAQAEDRRIRSICDKLDISIGSPIFEEARKLEKHGVKTHDDYAVNSVTGLKVSYDHEQYIVEELELDETNMGGD